ncbi:UDP-N-acetylmuramoyl-L-alanyl-D-glutamate--2,6-diaminopimelate ligase [bacterium]|nr:UDP-N-acetylmuramoyl-L-alanyl-D-glutamate--2,6-diaminopimelate ligase [bacterium]
MGHGPRHPAGRPRHGRQDRDGPEGPPGRGLRARPLHRDLRGLPAGRRSPAGHRHGPRRARLGAPLRLDERRAAVRGDRRRHPPDHRLAQRPAPRPHHRPGPGGRGRRDRAGRPVPGRRTGSPATAPGGPGGHGRARGRAGARPGPGGRWTGRSRHAGHADDPPCARDGTIPCAGLDRAEQPPGPCDRGQPGPRGDARGNRVRGASGPGARHPAIGCADHRQPGGGLVTVLAELLAPWPELRIHGDPGVAVGAVVEDSRQVAPGDLFVAVAGHGADGHAYVAQAAAAGAAAILIDEARFDELRAAPGTDSPVTWVTASRTRGLSARLAREREGRPDDHLCVAGVTGTNGKTTTAFLLQAVLAARGGPCGLLGTIRYDDGREQVTAPLTTPGGPVLYRWLARMRAAGCRSVALEISSHALDQERTADLAVDAALLTNLGRDHLDYHGTMEAYLAAKRRIVDLLAGERRRAGPGVLVVNDADPALAPIGNPAGERVGFSVDPTVTGADLRLRSADLALTGSRLELDWRGERLTLASGLVGRFNVENLTAALAVGLALGLDAATCLDALATVDQVPGRMERFLLPSGALAVVDYAHTHDALAAVLETARELVEGELSVVFGCGGDRDRGKRPLMARVVAELADTAWITSDNPRSEDPQAICDDVVTGFDAVEDPRAGRREVVVDRTRAIEAALADAGAGDVVVIAGKGHEDYQLVGDRVLHLDDREIVRHWIARRSDGR